MAYRAHRPVAVEDAKAATLRVQAAFHPCQRFRRRTQQVAARRLIAVDTSAGEVASAGVTDVEVDVGHQFCDVDEASSFGCRRRRNLRRISGWRGSACG
jgi:hypothetical protein